MRTTVTSIKKAIKAVNDGLGTSLELGLRNDAYYIDVHDNTKAGHCILKTLFSTSELRMISVWLKGFYEGACLKK